MELEKKYPPNCTASQSKGRNMRNKFPLLEDQTGCKIHKISTMFLSFSGVSKRPKRGSVYTPPSIIKISNDRSYTSTSLYSFKVRCLRARESLLMQLTEAKQIPKMYFIVPSVSQYRYIDWGLTDTQHAEQN